MASSLKTSAPVTYATWATGTIYTFGQQVIHNGYLYVCTTTHTSGTFDTDFFASNYWSAMTAPKDGWTPLSSTYTYASADSPTFTMTVPGDLRNTGPSVGQRIKLDQSQALTAYWAFQNNVEAINGWVMTDIGTPTYTAGKFSNALTLNGTDQALKVADNSFTPAGAFTIGFWMKSPTPATQWLFQSMSVDTAKFGGFYLRTLTGSGYLYALGSKATSNVANVDYISVAGKKNVCDNAFHYIVMTYKDNWMQVYVDGVLDISTYMVTIAYNATTYTRIGVSSETGTSDAGTWFSGYIDDLFLIDGYALDEQTIRKKYEAGTAQGTSAINVTKNFIISLPPTYSTPNTTITMDGGTDFSLTSGTISNVYFSGSKAPKDFNTNPDKWSVILTDKILHSKAAPSDYTTWHGGANAWSSGNSIFLAAPVGLRKVIMRCVAEAYYPTHECSMSVTLSNTNNSESYPELTGQVLGYDDCGMTLTIIPDHEFLFLTKTTLYLLVRADAGSMNSIYINATSSKTIIKIINAYL